VLPFLPPPLNSGELVTVGEEARKDRPFLRRERAREREREREREKRAGV
jgi:hypothetical protein